MKTLIAKEIWDEVHVDYERFERWITDCALETDTAVLKTQFLDNVIEEINRIDALFCTIVMELGIEFQRITSRVGLSRKTPWEISLSEERSLFYAVLDLSAELDALRHFVIRDYLTLLRVRKKFDKRFTETTCSEVLDILADKHFFSSPNLNQLCTETLAFSDRVILWLYDLGFKNNIITTDQPSCSISLSYLPSPRTLSCKHRFSWICLGTLSNHKTIASLSCRRRQSLDLRDYEVDGELKRFIQTYADDKFKTHDSKRRQIILYAAKLATSLLRDMARRYANLHDVGRYLKEPGALSIAHRGASSVVTGNTLPAFEKAIEMGADMIELDVRICSSGELVVFHDARLKEGMLIASLPFVSLRESFAPEIPSLHEALDLINNRTPVYFDVKGRGAMAPLMEALRLRVLNDGWTANNILIASFDHLELVEAQKLRSGDTALAEIRTVALMSSIHTGLAKDFEELGVDFISVEGNVMREELLEDAHKRGLGVMVWTVNNSEEIVNMLNMGVDGVISDHPDRVIQLRKEHVHSRIATVQVNPGIEASATTTVQSNRLVSNKAVEIEQDARAEFKSELSRPLEVQLAW